MELKSGPVSSVAACILTRAIRVTSWWKMNWEISWWKTKVCTKLLSWLCGSVVEDRASHASGLCCVFRRFQLLLSVVLVLSEKRERNWPGMLPKRGSVDWILFFLQKVSLEGRYLSWGRLRTLSMNVYFFVPDTALCRVLPFFRKSLNVKA